MPKITVHYKFSLWFSDSFAENFVTVSWAGNKWSTSAGRWNTLRYIRFVFDLLIHHGDVKFVGDVYNGENVNSPFQKVPPTKVILELVPKLEQLKYKTKHSDWNPHTLIIWDQY